MSEIIVPKKIDFYHETIMIIRENIIRNKSKEDDYVEHEGTNCYAYALGSTIRYNDYALIDFFEYRPGAFSGSLGVDYKEGGVERQFEDDMEALKFGVRRVKCDAINTDSELVIALLRSAAPNSFGFHFMRRSYNGDYWMEKPGYTNAPRKVLELNSNPNYRLLSCYGIKI